MIHVTATLIREGVAQEMPLRDLVLGDIIKLSAGDMIPGDVRVLSARDLFVSQGSLTGESLPVEKFHKRDARIVSSPTEFGNTASWGRVSKAAQRPRLWPRRAPTLTSAAWPDQSPRSIVLTNNLLYDFSQVPIPIDAVDDEQVARPRPWNIAEITRFILYIGLISSIFDYTTFFVMLWVFHCWDPARASVFQTGWFVESLLT